MSGGPQPTGSDQTAGSDLNGGLTLPWAGLGAALPDTAAVPLPWLPGLVPPPLLDLGLRLTAKRLLSGLREPGPLRRSMEVDAALFRHPAGARYAPDSVQTAAGALP
ncbi:MAG: hypothetical protein AAF899_14430, partial [Pseudomonadota bacterium]